MQVRTRTIQLFKSTILRTIYYVMQRIWPDSTFIVPVSVHEVLIYVQNTVVTISNPVEA